MPETHGKTVLYKKRFQDTTCTMHSFVTFSDDVDCVSHARSNLSRDKVTSARFLVHFEVAEPIVKSVQLEEAKHIMHKDHRPWTLILTPVRCLDSSRGATASSCKGGGGISCFKEFRSA